MPLELVAALIVLALVAYLGVAHSRRVDRQNREATRAAIKADEEMLAQTLVNARERARLVYPDLLTVEDAKPSRSIAVKLTDDERHEIEVAQDLLRKQLGASGYEDEDEDDRSNPHYVLGGDEEWSILQTTRYHEPEPQNVAKYLGEPIRIVDCGDAGSINLYSPEQVRVAQERSGVLAYIDFHERRAKAPAVAKQILARVAAKAKQGRDAEAARIASITTKLDELPSLPPKKVGN